MLSKKYLAQCTYNDFCDKIQEKSRAYNSLANLRTHLAKIEERDRVTNKKIKFLQGLMDSQLKENKVVTKRRIPGTGQRVIVKVPYIDSVENRKSGKFGKYYEVVRYENAEYDERVQKSMRRVKMKRKRAPEDPDAPKKRNLWIEAMQIAKERVGAPRFVKVRKEITDETDPDQVMGHKVYLEAKAVHTALKEEVAAERARAANAEPSVDGTQTQETVTATQVKEDEVEEGEIIVEPVKKPKRTKRKAKVVNAEAVDVQTISPVKKKRRKKKTE